MFNNDDGIEISNHCCGIEGRLNEDSVRLRKKEGSLFEGTGRGRFQC